MTDKKTDAPPVQTWKELESADFTGVTFGGEGDEGTVTPLCPECQQELTVVGNLADWRVRCGCDDPPRTFELNVEVG